MSLEKKTHEVGDDAGYGGELCSHRGVPVGRRRGNCEDLWRRLCLVCSVDARRRFKIGYVTFTSHPPVCLVDHMAVPEESGGDRPDIT